MIEQIVELFRKADESAWVETESGGYVCIDGHFDVAIIEAWLAEVIRKAKEEAWDEGWVSETFVWNPYRQGEE